MTCKPWDMIGTSVAARVVCAVLVLGSAIGVAQAQDADANTGTKYAQVLADVDTLQSNNDILQQLVASQEKQIAGIVGRTKALDGAVAKVEPLLQKMYQKLVSFVASDLPFLKQVRSQSLEQLGEIMAQDKAYGEKFRRLIEAYQIEIGYGRTMKAYQGELPDGRKADFVHVGRVTLLYRTDDGEESGYWNAAKGQWVADPGLTRTVANALAMAKEETAPDLIVVPVPAATETHS